MSRLPRSIQFFIVKVRFRLAAELRHRAIRRAYGIQQRLFPAIAAAAGVVCLIGILGTVAVSPQRPWRVFSALASVRLSGIEARMAKLERKVEQATGYKLSGIDKTLMPYAFLVDKKAKELVIFANNGNSWSFVKKYSVVVGEKAGRKQTAGDKRTPEGLYWIIGERFSNELDTSLYGDHAYVLNYPNRFDVKEGRTGTGIWLHGTSRSVSRGCVTLKKEDLVDIAAYSLVGVPVLIRADADGKAFDTFLEKTALLEDRDSVFGSNARKEEMLYEFIRDWGSAWRSVDIARYRNFYSPAHFSSGGLDYNGWVTHKEEVFRRSEGKIRLNLYNFDVARLTDTLAEIHVSQFYQSANMSDSARKQLRLARENGNWKIISETIITN